MLFLLIFQLLLKSSLGTWGKGLKTWDLKNNEKITYPHIPIYIHLDVYTYISPKIHICMCVWICIRICVYMYVYVHISIYLYILVYVRPRFLFQSFTSLTLCLAQRRRRGRGHLAPAAIETRALTRKQHNLLRRITRRHKKECIGLRPFTNFPNVYLAENTS